MYRCLLFIAIAGCSSSTPTVRTVEPAKRVEIPGIANAFAVSDRYFNGGEPENDAAFEALQKLGVTTIISVDSRAPDAATAARYGITTIHLPVGFHGIDTRTARSLAKAAQTAEGKVFIHDKLGRHRGPTALAVIRLSLEPDYTPAAAMAWLEQAGCDPRYKSLWAMPTIYERPSESDLAAVPAEFVSRMKVNGLTLSMTRIDQDCDALERLTARDWLGAESSAALLAEDFREAMRSVEASGKGDEFNRWLRESEEQANAIIQHLKSNDLPAASAAWEKTKAGCIQCHSKFRD